MAEIDPFAWETDDDDDAKEAAALRKERNRLGKLYREAQAKVAELEPFKVQIESQARETALTKAFSEAGVSVKQVKLFTALNKDVDPATVTKDVVLAFAQEYEIPVASAESPAPAPAATPAPAAPTGFKPVTAADASAPGAALISSERLAEILKTDPAEADRLVREGQVDLQLTL